MNSTSTLSVIALSPNKTDVLSQNTTLSLLMALNTIAAATGNNLVENTPADLGNKALSKATKQYQKIKGPNREIIWTANPMFNPNAASERKQRRLHRLKNKLDKSYKTVAATSEKISSLDIKPKASKPIQKKETKQHSTNIKKRFFETINPIAQLTEDQPLQRLPVANFTSTDVYHFGGQSKQWQLETIPNISELDQIISAGSYAWAISHSGEVAFYNGEQWAESSTIPGLTKFLNLLPGFPISGKRPIAWARGKDAQSHIVFSYFDGNNWNAPTIIYPTASETATIVRASAGYLWVTYFQSNNKICLAIAGDNHPTTLLDLNIPNNLLSDWDVGTLDDDEAVWYVADGDRKIFTKVHPDGSYQVIANFTDMKNNFVTDYLMRGDSIFINTYNNLLTFSKNRGATWNTLQLNIPFDSFLYQQNWYYNGLLCSSDLATPVPSKQFICLNTNAATPSESTFTLPISKPTMWWLYAASSGVWIPGYDLATGTPYVFLTDVNNTQWIDTELQNTASGITHIQPTLRSISQNEVITVGSDKSNKNAALYYNGTFWAAKPLPNSMQDYYSYCLSFPGKAPARAPTVENSNVWIFGALEKGCNNRFENEDKSLMMKLR